MKFNVDESPKPILCVDDLPHGSIFKLTNSNDRSLYLRCHDCVLRFHGEYLQGFARGAYGKFRFKCDDQKPFSEEVCTEVARLTITR